LKVKNKLAFTLSLRYTLYRSQGQGGVRAMKAYQTKQTRDINITIRSYVQERDFIDHAAKVAGKNRSDFMLEAAKQKAEETLLDQRLFLLNEKDMKAFMDILDNPPEPNEAFRKLMSTPAPWEK